MKCQKCGVRESTGIIIHMCDPCFDAWEAAVHELASRSADGKAHFTDEQFEELAGCMKKGNDDEVV